MADSWSQSGEQWAEAFGRQSATRAETALDLTLRLLREAHQRKNRRRETSAAKNVEKWFRQLPPDLVQTLAAESTGTMHGDAHLINVANDWLLDHGFNAKTAPPRRGMTADERALARALSKCRLGSAGFEKRFVRTLGAQLRERPPQITDGQARLLPGLTSKYRKQIPRRALPRSLRHLLTDEAAKAARERRMHGR